MDDGVKQILAMRLESAVSYLIITQRRLGWVNDSNAENMTSALNHARAAGSSVLMIVFGSAGCDPDELEGIKKEISEFMLASSQKFNASFTPVNEQLFKVEITYQLPRR